VGYTVIDDNLDLVNSQKSLAITLSQGSLIESRQSIETQANLITSRVAPNLGNRPAFAQLYSEFTARLLRNETVSAEDTIDLLTLKENNQSNETDYAAALDILVRAKVRTQFPILFCLAELIRCQPFF
jgi:nuclear pore complex protein Nup133